MAGAGAGRRDCNRRATTDTRGLRYLSTRPQSGYLAQSSTEVFTRIPSFSSTPPSRPVSRANCQNVVREILFEGQKTQQTFHASSNRQRSAASNRIIFFKPYNVRARPGRGPGSAPAMAPGPGTVPVSRQVPLRYLSGPYQAPVRSLSGPCQVPVRSLSGPCQATARGTTMDQATA